MSRASRARKIATAAMYGGGGIGAVGAIVTGLIVSQIRQAWQTIPPSAAAPPNADGRYGDNLPGDPLRLAVLGDSSAAGLGVEHPDETPGALLASNLSRIAGRPVELSCLAVVGALSANLHTQVRQATPLRPDLTLIMIGGNDVTHRVWPSVAVRHLSAAVRELRAINSEVVVGTCPDLGTIEPIRPPLRWLARRWSRELAAAQTIAVVEAGGRTVSLGDLLGPEFARAPDRLFSADQFHPSATGYAAAAAAVLPAFAVALALVEDAAVRRAQARGRSGVSSLPRAAVTAAYHAGTEVSGTEVAGAERGPSGRWAQVRQWMLGWAGRTPEDARAQLRAPQHVRAQQPARPNVRRGPKGPPAMKAAQKPAIPASQGDGLDPASQTTWPQP
ncbi:MAG: SGNH/GDSL hydrolase family protein [Micromonosporaceae bacterium]